MKTDNSKWLVKMGLLFAAISAGVYYLFYITFHDTDFIFHHFMIDLAFVPIDVFLVATIFEKLMGRREKQARRERMHLIISSFIYEVGSDLIKSFATYVCNATDTGQSFKLDESWSKTDFDRFKTNLNNITSEVQFDVNHLTKIKDLLFSKNRYLLHLMENDNLMESERFSQLVLALFHLYEELQLRQDLNNLNPKDLDHLTGDLKRTYLLLSEQWIDYLYHIKESTPYLYSLAIRTNPFDPDARVEIK
jgi:hypothetical protein